MSRKTVVPGRYRGYMKTVVLGDPPLVLTSLIADRKRLGLDSHDEAWNGEYQLSS
jgi:hypothetical protein